MNVAIPYMFTFMDRYKIIQRQEQMKAKAKESNGCAEKNKHFG